MSRRSKRHRLARDQHFRQKFRQQQRPPSMPVANVARAGITLTEEQERAVSLGLASLTSGNPLYRIGGYAGTGKTTIARWIVDALGPSQVAVAAFTGKAASVLRRKGLDGNTIHSTIYRYENEEWHRLHVLPVKYILIDEGSMVARDLWEDLQWFGLPTLVIGDPGQLEPVGDDPRLMHNPDFVLEQIHRQAAQSAIIEFADKVRRGLEFRHGCKGQVGIEPKSKSPEAVGWADQILCGFNKTRVEVNTLSRRHRGYNQQLVEGDRLIVLQNDKGLAIYNGMMMTVQRVRQFLDYYHCDVQMEDGELRRDVPVWKGHFNLVKSLSREALWNVRGMAVVDYGYCATVHKSQGSEWDKVAVIDEQCSVWEPARHRYTAITRASEELRFFYN